MAKRKRSEEAEVDGITERNSPNEKLSPKKKRVSESNAPTSETSKKKKKDGNKLTEKSWGKSSKASGSTKKPSRRILRVEPLVPERHVEQPSAEDVFVHGALSLKLPPADIIQKMPTDYQHNYLRKITTQCEKLIDTVHNCLQSFEKNTDDVGVEQQLTADMVRLKKVPLAKQYVEMTLWRRAKLFSRARLETAEKLGFGKGAEDSIEGSGLLLEKMKDGDPNFVSYREAYLDGVLSRYAEDFETVRQKEQLTARKTELLAESLRLTAELFANIKCIEEKQRRDRKE